MKKLKFVSFTIFCVGITFFSCGTSNSTLPKFVKDEMQLVWADEFEDESDEPKLKNWDYKEGSHGWGNNEVQNYTKDRQNSYVSNGTLKITAIKNEKQKWTSARLFSQYKKSFTYGYLEFRAKVPTQKGCWPAIWLLPENNVYGIWPRSGEIDIMEASQNMWGSKVFGTVHCLLGNGGNPILSVGTEVKKMDKRWHTYAINWTQEGITWYYDGKVVANYRNPHSEEDAWQSWPYDKPFYIIMNVAMGGNLGGDIDQKVESCTMEIDYVRLYQ